MSWQRILGALLMAPALAGVGYLVGQYAPFTGLAPLGEPFSPIRNQAAQSYALIGGVIGLFVGLAVKPRKAPDDDRPDE